MVLATGDEQGDADMANDPTESGAAPLTEAERNEQASQVVDRFSLWSGAAGLVPIPISTGRGYAWSRGSRGNRRGH